MPLRPKIVKLMDKYSQKRGAASSIRPCFLAPTLEFRAMPLRPELAYPEARGRSSPFPFNETLQNAGLPPISDAELQSIAAMAEGHPNSDPKRFMEGARQLGFSFVGGKPEESAVQDTTIMIQVPEDRLVIRFFTGGTAVASHVWFFDFYDPVLRRAVNAPRGYTLTVVSPTALAGPLPSVESILLVNEPTKAGGERFTSTEGTSCSLKRPGREPFSFDVPARQLMPERLPTVLPRRY
ncbi:hypothetical protein DFH07DRAFT_843633 [Mycena maculata]|uniref:Uncharacterized protein n=1 Tax=Mycena maculata TaxID=230809 RepID=A0AAD7I5I8_9AGAR|nr:hypothetical protein DFH07DRAFT_843633 [Mycena maculata]